MEHNDHRVIGQRLDLFHLQEEGPGMVFWHPNGFALYRIVEDYIRRRMKAAGFAEIRSPQVLSRGLWEASGHWQKFSKQMYALAAGEENPDEDEGALALKPMSCPGHVLLFNQRPRSHRDLPLRYSEFGACLRNEPSGALLGLMRTRGFHQDDAHLFCKPEQVEAEVVKFCHLLDAVYRDFGFEQVAVGFSTRPAERAGSDALWDRAEATLEAAARAAGLDPLLQPGEGAFYGPKLEFALRDRRGRVWQCGTIQVDLVLPERLDASYVAADGNRERPVMLHQAVLGSLERFIGVLLEHHEGHLPLWLAPEQILVASVAEAQAGYAAAVAETLGDLGYRARADQRGERLARKIAEAHDFGIPIVAIVGKREAADGTVMLRRPNGDQQALDLVGLDRLLREEAFR